MDNTTYEEACKCPKCQEPGEAREKRPAKNLARGTEIHSVYCRNERCKWYDTCWFVQVNPDGSVPPPKDHTGEPKIYEHFEGHDDMANRIRAGLARQREAEVSGEGEIRG